MKKDHRLVTLRCPDYIFDEAEKYGLENDILFNGKPNVSAVILYLVTTSLNLKRPYLPDYVSPSELESRLAELEATLRAAITAQANLIKSELIANGKLTAGFISIDDKIAIAVEAALRGQIPLAESEGAGAGAGDGRKKKKSSPITQQQLARDFGIKGSNISFYCKGRIPNKLNDINALIEACTAYPTMFPEGFLDKLLEAKEKFSGNV